MASMSFIVHGEAVLSHKDELIRLGKIIREYTVVPGFLIEVANLSEGKALLQYCEDHNLIFEDPDDFSIS